jgi:hypothetical protein
MGNFLTREILVKSVLKIYKDCHIAKDTNQLSVFFRNSQAIQICDVSKAFKISTDEKKIHMNPIDILRILNGLIDAIQLSMAAALHRNVQSLRHPSCAPW